MKRYHQDPEGVVVGKARLRSKRAKRGTLGHPLPLPTPPPQEPLHPFAYAVPSMAPSYNVNKPSPTPVSQPPPPPVEEPPLVETVVDVQPLAETVSETVPETVPEAVDIGFTYLPFYKRKQKPKHKIKNAPRIVVSETIPPPVLEEEVVGEQLPLTDTQLPQGWEKQPVPEQSNAYDIMCFVDDLTRKNNMDVELERVPLTTATLPEEWNIGQSTELGGFLSGASFNERWKEKEKEMAQKQEDAALTKMEVDQMNKEFDEESGMHIPGPVESIDQSMQVEPLGQTVPLTNAVLPEGWQPMPQSVWQDEPLHFRFHQELERVLSDEMVFEMEEYARANEAEWNALTAQWDKGTTLAFYYGNTLMAMLPKESVKGFADWFAEMLVGEPGIAKQKLPMAQAAVPVQLRPVVMLINQLEQPVGRQTDWGTILKVSALGLATVGLLSGAVSGAAVMYVIGGVSYALAHLPALPVMALPAVALPAVGPTVVVLSVSTLLGLIGGKFLYRGLLSTVKNGITYLGEASKPIVNSVEQQLYHYITSNSWDAPAAEQRQQNEQELSAFINNPQVEQYPKFLDQSKDLVLNTATVLELLEQQPLNEDVHDKIVLFLQQLKQLELPELDNNPTSQSMMLLHNNPLYLNMWEVATQQYVQLKRMTQDINQHLEQHEVLQAKEQMEQLSLLWGQLEQNIKSVGELDEQMTRPFVNLLEATKAHRLKSGFEQFIIEMEHHAYDLSTAFMNMFGEATEGAIRATIKDMTNEVLYHTVTAGVDALTNLPQLFEKMSTQHEEALPLEIRTPAEVHEELQVYERIKTAGGELALPTEEEIADEEALGQYRTPGQLYRTPTQVNEELKEYDRLKALGVHQELTDAAWERRMRQRINKVAVPQWQRRTLNTNHITVPEPPQKTSLFAHAAPEPERVVTESDLSSDSVQGIHYPWEILTEVIQDQPRRLALNGLSSVVLQATGVALELPYFEPTTQRVLITLISAVIRGVLGKNMKKEVLKGVLRIIVDPVVDKVLDILKQELSPLYIPFFHRMTERYMENTPVLHLNGLKVTRDQLEQVYKNHKASNYEDRSTQGMLFAVNQDKSVNFVEAAEMTCLGTYLEGCLSQGEEWFLKKLVNYYTTLFKPQRPFGVSTALYDSFTGEKTLELSGGPDASTPGVSIPPEEYHAAKAWFLNNIDAFDTRFINPKSAQMTALVSRFILREQKDPDVKRAWEEKNKGLTGTPNANPTILDELFPLLLQSLIDSSKESMAYNQQRVSNVKKDIDVSRRQVQDIKNSANFKMEAYRDAMKITETGAQLLTKMKGKRDTLYVQDTKAKIDYAVHTAGKPLVLGAIFLAQETMNMCNAIANEFTTLVK